MVTGPFLSRGMGRRPAEDERDTRFQLRTLMRAIPSITLRHWRTGPVLDQGNTSQCVGYAWRQWLTSAPVMQSGGPVPESIYREAQKVDEWPGEGYDGTSVRAGAKVLQDQGFITSYWWASNAEDVRDYVLQTAPVVVGTDWLSNMFHVDARGFLDVSGFPVGGHAWLICGYSTDKQAFRMINSWGKTDFGEAGRAWIRFSDFQMLLSRNGEACAAIEARVR